MILQTHPQALAYYVTAILLALLAAYTLLRHPTNRTNSFFALFLGCTMIWTWARGFEISSDVFKYKLFWATIEVIAIAWVPLMWLLFVTHYVDHRSDLYPEKAGFLTLPPLITTFLALTNQWHGLIWRTITLVQDDPFTLLARTYGVWAWGYLAFSLLTFTWGIFVFASWTHVSFYPLQSALFIAFGLNIAIMAFLNFTIPDLLSPVIYVLPTAFIVTAVLGLSVYHLNFLDVTPLSQQAVMHKISDGILTIDTFERVTSINKAATHMLGKAENEVLGRPIDAVLDHLPDLLMCIETGVTQELSWSSNDKLCTYQLNISQLRDPMRRARGKLLVLYDITERKKSEQMRQDLVRMLIHDLRSPLSASYLLIDGLEKDTDNRIDALKRERMLKNANRNLKRVMNMVNEILDINRLETGTMPIYPQRTCLTALISAVLQTQNPAAEKRSIQLNSQFPDNLPAVWCDASLIQRVLENLLANAIRFTFQEGVIYITADLVLDQRPHLRINVTDTGTGIPPGELDYLFDKYTSNPERGGTGLGLAFCRLVLEAHGERIWVEETSSKGTTFAFTLPLARTIEQEIDISFPSDTAENTSETSI